MDDHTAQTKICTNPDCLHAGQPQLLESFSHQKTTKDKRRSWCKSCCARASREYHAIHRDGRANYAKQWRASNVDYIREYNKTYKNDHRDETQEKHREWIANNRERVRKWRHDYYLLHQDEQNASAREWAKSHREQHQQTKRQWRLKNIDKERTYTRRRVARRRALPATFTDADWRRALEYFSGCCAICNNPPDLWHVIAADHWIPLSDSRPDNPGTVPVNIVPMCHARKGGVGGCNNSKLNRDPHYWLIDTYGKRTGKQIEDRIHEYFASLA
jgi:hypothetical protein